MTSHKQRDAALVQALIQFHKECLGRGPEVCQVLWQADFVLFRCRRVLTPHEAGLLQLPDYARNRLLIKHMRREMMEQHADRLKAAVSAIVGEPVVSMHCDLSTAADESVTLLTFDSASVQPVFRS